jgi:hypothetical protein
MSGLPVELAAKREMSLRSELKMRLSQTAAHAELAIIAAENYACETAGDVGSVLAAMVYELRTIRATVIGYREQL